jgi:anaerobic ribonucleoside-triphosphate reductase
MVSINLPRIVQESELNQPKFLEILKERFEFAARALEIKQRALRQHGRNSLPFLCQVANGDVYFRFESCSNIVNLVGFREAIGAFPWADTTSDDFLSFTQAIAQTIQSSKARIGRKLGKRLFTAILPSQTTSERFAQLDIEKFGLAKTKFSGDREKPFYLAADRVSVGDGVPLKIASSYEGIFESEGLGTGGSLAIVELSGPEYTPGDLLDLSTQLMDNPFFEFFTYKRRMTYCSNCRNSYFGLPNKCPKCGAVSTLTVFDRFSYT